MNQTSDLLDKTQEGLSARLIALHLLDQVLSRKKSLDDVLKNDGDFKALADRDRGFARMLVSTTLRRLGQIDTLIVKASNHGELPKPNRLLDIIRLGCTQIFFMDVADHAAVDTSVRMAREKQRGFANAVLRRMTSEGREWIKSLDDTVNIPDWLYAQWENDYGPDNAKNLASATLVEASLDITVKDPEETMIWAGTLEATKMPSGSLRRPSGGRIDHLAGFQDGAWWIQDAAAAMPAKLFGDVAGQRVIDLCAAPGGKTAQLAAMGAQVTAVDRSAGRMRTLGSNLERLNLKDHVETVISDGAIWQPSDPAPYVLLDAPCSATGTIRRHPDVMHLKEYKDQESLMRVQARLLKNAANITANGGTLIYCTCSLQKDEGERQIQIFLAEHPEFSAHPINSGELGGSKDIIDENGFARILPYHWAARGGMDGFFIARLKKS